MTFPPATRTFESSDESPRIISNYFKEHIYRKTRLMTLHASPFQMTQP